MKIIAVILVVIATLFVMFLDAILEALPWAWLQILGVVAAGVLLGLASMAVLCAMHSSMISRIEERERGRNPLPERFQLPKTPPPAPPPSHRNHAVPMGEYDRVPRGYKWS